MAAKKPAGLSQADRWDEPIPYNHASATTYITNELQRSGRLPKQEEVDAFVQRNADALKQLRVSMAWDKSEAGQHSRANNWEHSSVTHEQKLRDLTAIKNGTWTAPEYAPKPSLTKEQRGVLSQHIASTTPGSKSPDISKGSISQQMQDMFLTANAAAKPAKKSTAKSTTKKPAAKKAVVKPAKSSNIVLRGRMPNG